MLISNDPLFGKVPSAKEFEFPSNVPIWVVTARHDAVFALGRFLRTMLYRVDRIQVEAGRFRAHYLGQLYSNKFYMLYLVAFAGSVPAAFILNPVFLNLPSMAEVGGALQTVSTDLTGKPDRQSAAHNN